MVCFYSGSSFSSGDRKQTWIINDNYWILLDIIGTLSGSERYFVVFVCVYLFLYFF